LSENEEVYELILDFANALEAAAVSIKQRVSQKVKTPQVSEGPFLTLKYEKRTGNKLKDFEVATKTLNSSSEDFTRCLNILKRNKATIQDRFHDQGWRFSFWEYNEAIYLQPLKK